MPCYQVNLTTVNFNAKYLDLLELAAKEKNLPYYKNGNYIRIGKLEYAILDNKISTRANNGQELINSLKREYSRQIIKKTAKTNGWKLNKKNNNKYLAIKF